MFTKRVVARLSFVFCYWVYKKLFAGDKRATSFGFWMFRVFLRVCVVCEIGTKKTQVDEDLSRSSVCKYLEKHPRSPWWINNVRLADFCCIKPDIKVHNTINLGKYLPHPVLLCMYLPLLFSFPPFS